MAQDIRKMWRDVLQKWMLRDKEPMEEKCWVPEIERANPDRIKEIQSEKLEVAFRYVCEYSPFYEEKYKKAGLTPKDIKSVEDLHKIPITDKEDLRESIRRKPPWGIFLVSMETFVGKTGGWYS